MARILRFSLFGLFLTVSLAALAASTSSFSLTNAFPGLIFTNPVCMASAPGETNRLFIVERKGRIVAITNLAVPTRTIFMDISSRVINATDSNIGGEEGLLGLAFHPQYASNGFFYVFYTGNAITTAGNGRHDILSRFQVSGLSGDQGDPASEIRLIVQYDEAFNHNGGDLHFGPDGYLYISLGDEGGAYDNWKNSQRIDRDFFSAIMRIDVDNRAGNLAPNPHTALLTLTNYSIPSDNPFVAATNFNGLPVNVANVRTEFWAVGMRNPWRFCFDSADGTLLLGHVGQDQIEWINIVTNGANCGWNYYEGTKKWTNSIPAGFSLTPPLFQYGHTNSRNCVIGGVVYRGSTIPPLYGAYLYTDHGNGQIWTLHHSGMTVITNLAVVTNTAAQFNAFGTDPATGDVLCAAARSGINSTIERLVYHAPPIPVITGISLAGTELLLSGSNGAPNQTYYLRASPDLALPVVDWSIISTGMFDASGSFTLTNPIEPSAPQSFYLLQLP